MSYSYRRKVRIFRKETQGELSCPTMLYTVVEMGREFYESLSWGIFFQYCLQLLNRKEPYFQVVMVIGI